VFLQWYREQIKRRHEPGLVSVIVLDHQLGIGKGRAGARVNRAQPLAGIDVDAGDAISAFAP
jgi:hypothetical protein